MSAKICLATGLALLAAFTLAGCSSDDIQFNGGVFDMVGLSDSARAKSSNGDPKLDERPPLVIPPTLNRLPQPGDPTAANPDPNLASIRDPDEIKTASQEELQKKQDEFCKVHYADAKVRGDDTVASVEGPLGPCRPSVLTSIKKWNASE